MKSLPKLFLIPQKFNMFALGCTFQFLLIHIKFDMFVGMWMSVSWNPGKWKYKCICDPNRCCGSESIFPSLRNPENGQISSGCEDVLNNTSDTCVCQMVMCMISCVDDHLWCISEGLKGNFLWGYLTCKFHSGMYCVEVLYELCEWRNAKSIVAKSGIYYQGISSISKYLTFNTTFKSPVI